jgi:hypothetical protein
VGNVKDVGRAVCDVEISGKVRTLQHFAHTAEASEIAGALTLRDNGPHFPMLYYYD